MKLPFPTFCARQACLSIQVILQQRISIHPENAAYMHQEHLSGISLRLQPMATFLQRAQRPTKISTGLNPKGPKYLYGTKYGLCSSNFPFGLGKYTPEWYLGPFGEAPDLPRSLEKHGTLPRAQHREQCRAPALAQLRDYNWRCYSLSPRSPETIARWVPLWVQVLNSHILTPNLHHKYYHLDPT